MIKRERKMSEDKEKRREIIEIYILHCSLRAEQETRGKEKIGRCGQQGRDSEKKWCTEPDCTDLPVTNPGECSLEWQSQDMLLIKI